MAPLKNMPRRPFKYYQRACAHQQEFRLLAMEVQQPLFCNPSFRTVFALLPLLPYILTQVPSKFTVTFVHERSRSTTVVFLAGSFLLPVITSTLFRDLPLLDRSEERRMLQQQHVLLIFQISGLPISI